MLSRWAEVWLAAAACVGGVTWSSARVAILELTPTKDPERVNGGGPGVEQDRQPSPSKPTVCHFKGIISSVPWAVNLELSIFSLVSLP
jgi:hypothetical protein